MKSVLVIGAGNFGATLASELASKKIEVTVIEKDKARADELRDEAFNIIVADGTHKDVLNKFGKDCAIAVVALGDKIDASILITLFLKEIGVKQIVAKAASVDHGKALTKVGATETIFPERDEAIRLATSLVSPDVMDFIRLSDDFNIVEIAAPDSFISKSIEDLDLRKKYGIQVLAIKNLLDDKVQILPPPAHVFRPDDVLIVIGETESLEKFRR